MNVAGHFVSTNASGYYSATVDKGTSGTVTPNKANYTFTPTSRPFSNLQQNLAGFDFVGVYSVTPPPPPPSPGTVTAQIIEPQSGQVFQVGV